MADPAPAPVLAAAPEPQAMGNPYNNPTVVFDSGSALAGAPEGALVEAGEGAAAAATGSSASDFASKVGGVGGAPAQAKAMTNPSTTVTQVLSSRLSSKRRSIPTYRVMFVPW